MMRMSWQQQPLLTGNTTRRGARVVVAVAGSPVVVTGPLVAATTLQGEGTTRALEVVATDLEVVVRVRGAWHSRARSSASG